MKAIIPPDLQSYYDDWHMSPGLLCNGFVFFTGFTGTRADGTLSNDPAEQIRDAFAKVESVLLSGGMSFEHIVEMTSYHVGLRDHLDLFKSIRDEYIREPYPAWTAIEVTGFVREDAIVEIRVIARQP
ncbi:RidA family protein [Pelagibius sp. Alg239-R121]|uniref:RidA family protein n=1 Tax=Pelagibius sp. Alg239-R121 TaxID=2993448 RepID=UPI0024A7415E|nr:RidA family protein [Pelagibius sp. Alg239-R121]